MEKDINNEELENIIVKYKKTEIKEEEFLQEFKKIKNQVKIYRIYRTTGEEIKDSVFTNENKLPEVLWKTDKGYDKFCYTSLEKYSSNKPNFETIAIPDEFINIVKDCIKDNQRLVINLNDETTLTFPIAVLKIFIDEEMTNKKTYENGITNKKYKEQLADTAISLLVNKKLISIEKDLKNLIVEFGYLLLPENHEEVSSLLKITVPKRLLQSQKVFYMGVQKGKMMLLTENFDENTFRKISKNMLNMHKVDFSTIDRKDYIMQLY